MLIQIISDCHLEHQLDGGDSFINTLPIAGNVLVIAGDFAPTRSHLGRIAKHLKTLSTRYKLVIMVFGNHEFWRSSVYNTLEDARQLKQSLPSNVQVFDQAGFAHLEEQRFVCCPLWFRFKADNAKFEVDWSDFQEIHGFKTWVYEQAHIQVNWLRQNVTEQDVVITHYTPSFRSVPPEYAGDEMNRFFVNDIEELVILEREPILFLHGHTHNSFDYMIGKTRVVCNPFGYAPRRLNPKFNEALSIEV